VSGFFLYLAEHGIHTGSIEVKMTEMLFILYIEICFLYLRDGSFKIFNSIVPTIDVIWI
jgi:hypothetical protein